jgi:hypothetical protein
VCVRPIGADFGAVEAGLAGRCCWPPPAAAIGLPGGGSLSDLAIGVLTHLMVAPIPIMYAVAPRLAGALGRRYQTGCQAGQRGGT